MRREWQTGPKKQLRKKIPQLQLALEGCLLPHHRLLLREMIEDLDHVAAKRPFDEAVKRWLTVPGIKHRLAWTLIAGVGPWATHEVFCVRLRLRYTVYCDHALHTNLPSSEVVSEEWMQPHSLTPERGAA